MFIMFGLESNSPILRPPNGPPGALPKTGIVVLLQYINNVDKTYVGNYNCNIQAIWYY